MTNAPDNLVRTVLTDPVHILAFGFGTGLSPVAPGTVGSLVGVLFAWLTIDLGLPLQLAVAVAISAAGIWICGESARRIGVHDHGGIVWDEIAGMYITLLAAPPTIGAWILGFVLFRVFDIAKPWPIRDLDHRLGGGLGIMLDDLAAALYALILLGLYGWLMT
ncbi:MAG: phosphatidylglycerophosphatase A [Gammaproteobacteria bacterium]|jgi:phosphatidylglycerophosphatase A|nr:phosphatidylglycerophosphatase A [Gammaproteobacteria bacterium]MDH3757831.1 phosphatidylglycerophosphatase A [Gammaproteobacteria bacterium]MDH3846357.1 phosphatidylglycerophosphatase A [Gammaproteobacteria bacterium]MDH3863735.1 phosphatidylglycerophosphatase A [Gammaproteobacteria bacterium]MDH3905500.1 phosphatidylglycerophosphatase A [Gammaproteobacteria bacterium]